MGCCSSHSVSYHDDAFDDIGHQPGDSDARSNRNGDEDWLFYMVRNKTEIRKDMDTLSSIKELRLQMDPVLFPSSPPLTSEVDDGVPNFSKDKNGNSDNKSNARAHKFFEYLFQMIDEPIENLAIRGCHEDSRVDERALRFLSNTSFPDTVKQVEIRFFQNLRNSDALNAFLFDVASKGSSSSRPQSVIIQHMCTAPNWWRNPTPTPTTLSGNNNNKSSVIKSVEINIGGLLDFESGNGTGARDFLAQVGNMPCLEELRVQNYKFSDSDIDIGPMLQNVLRNKKVQICFLKGKLLVVKDFGGWASQEELNTVLANNTALKIFQVEGQILVGNRELFHNVDHCADLNYFGKEKARNPNSNSSDIAELIHCILSSRRKVASLFYKQDCYILSLVFGILSQCPSTWSGTR